MRGGYLWVLEALVVSMGLSALLEVMVLKDPPEVQVQEAL